MFTTHERSHLYNPSPKAYGNTLDHEKSVSKKFQDKKNTGLPNIKTTTLNKKYVNRATNINSFAHSYAKFIQLETHHRIREIKPEGSRYRSLSQTIVFMCLLSATIMGLYSLSDVAQRNSMPVMSDLIIPTKKIL